MWGTGSAEGWRPGARSPWGQTPATHSCLLPWLGNCTGMLHLSLSKVRMQRASPVLLEVGDMCMEGRLTSLRLPQYTWAGQKEAHKDTYTCVHRQIRLLHTHTPLYMCAHALAHKHGVTFTASCPYTGSHMCAHTHFHTCRGTFIPTHFQTHM